MQDVCDVPGRAGPVYQNQQKKKKKKEQPLEMSPFHIYVQLEGIRDSGPCGL